MSDHKGAAVIYPMLPDAETIIADKGYDRDAFRDALGMPVMRQHRAFPQSRLLDPNQSQRFDLKGDMPGLLLRLAPFQCRSLI
jgi:hypothetical protein